MKYIIKRFNYLSEEKIDRLRKLTLYNGVMRDVIDDIRNEVKRPAHYAAAIVTKYDRIVGWGLIGLKERFFLIYIVPEYRRRHVGKLIWKRSATYLRRNKIKKLYAFPWNRKSTKFFESIGFEDAIKDDSGISFSPLMSMQYGIRL